MLNWAGQLIIMGYYITSEPESMYVILYIKMNQQTEIDNILCPFFAQLYESWGKPVVFAVQGGRGSSINLKKITQFSENIRK